MVSSANPSYVISRLLFACVITYITLPLLSSEVAGPVITAQPRSTSIYPGNWAKFSVSAEGSGTLNYQWFFNDEPLPRQTRPTVDFLVVSQAQQGKYWVEVSDMSRTVKSATASLWVSALPVRHSVSLQNATATFHHPDFSPAYAIDGESRDNFGWAIQPRLTNQTMVVETVRDFAIAGNTTFEVELSFQHFPAPPANWSPLGRFRLSATTDPREAFANGVATDADLPANWIVLDPISVGALGAVLRELDDHSILTVSNSSWQDVYTITFKSPVTAITGFRLEALEDPSLPHSGPGVEPVDGSFCLSEFIVRSDTAPGLLGPVFTAHPVSEEVDLHGSASLRASAEGGAALSYQWYLNGAPIASAGSATLDITDVTPEKEGTYSAVATDQYGSTSSMGAVLRIRSPVPAGEVWFRHTMSPASLQIKDSYLSAVAGPRYLAQLYAGNSATQLNPVGPAVPFRAGVQAGYFDDGVRTIPGTTPGAEHFFSIRAWDSAAGETYDQALVNGGQYGSSEVRKIIVGGGTNPPAELTGLMPFKLTGGKPRIYSQSSSETLAAGSRIVLYADATGSDPMTYQWFKDGAPLSGAVQSRLLFATTTVADSGTYHVPVTNQFGSATSAPIVIVIRDIDRQPPIVTITSPTDSATTATRVIFKGTVSDDVNLSKVEWGIDDEILGEVSLTEGKFTLPINLPIGDTTLFVRAFDEHGNSATDAVSFTIKDLPEVILNSTWEPEGSGVKVTLKAAVQSEIRYSVEASTDLNSWTEIGDANAVDGQLYFTDSSAESRRYYRFKSLQ